MKAAVYTLKGEKKGEASLPSQFSEPIRTDLIKRAVLAVQSNNYQPHGSDPRAGTKQGKATPKQRKKYGTTYGHGISRVKRKIMWRRGTQFGWVSAFVANAVGGRKAFPPHTDKVLTQKLNVKERRKAICSAIAATADKELVIARNHKIGKSVPLVIEDKFEDTNKTKDVLDIFDKLGLNEELARTSKKKIRAGRGKTRGRKYKTKVGPLLIVSKDCKLAKSAKNIPGVQITNVKDLNAELLAPGTQPGRLTIWTEDALKIMDKEALFK